MSELTRLFCELKTHFRLNLNWVDVEQWLYGDGEECSNEVWQQRAQNFWSLINNREEEQLQTLRELASVIRSMRTEDQPGYDNTYDNWANIINAAPANAYLAYIYAVSCLANPLPEHVRQAAPALKLNWHTNVQLSLNAISTYFLTLTIPGAKTYGVFEEDVIEHCLKVFKLLEQNVDREVFANSLWMNFLTICDDLKLLFRYVHFKEHIKARDKIVRCLMEILYMNFKSGYVNKCAPALHTKCFEVFDEIANEHNGDVYNTLLLILQQTFPMHIYGECPKGGNRNGQSIEHISAWFIKLLDKYPEIMAKILNLYIETVISNPIKAWKPADEKIAIGYAAKYDAALYGKCNKSCADYVMEAVKADDAVSIQTRALELVDRILQHQTVVEWSIFRYDVSTIPREVALIKETILCLNDRTFTVRRKASQVLISALKYGSAMTAKILDESIRFVQYNDEDVEAPQEPKAQQHELRFEKPGIYQYAFSFEGHDMLEEEVKNLPQIIYERFLNSDNGLARTSGITLLERLILINPLIIYNTNFVREMSMLAVDRLASVRKAALECIETLLQAYCNCFALICVYCRIWACLLSDEDVALQKLAMQSFNQIVLKNIQPLENSNEPKHFMPWRIVTTLLLTQPRAYLQERFGELLDKQTMVTSKLVHVIISHLSTPTATEAWALLLLLSSRITNNLDELITYFNSLSSYNMKTNQVLALQLIICCLPNFSKPALNNLFKLLLEHLRTGSIWLGLISTAVSLLKQMHHLSISQSPLQRNDDESWLTKLLEDVNDSILFYSGNFQNEHTRLQSLLATYTEIVVMLPLHVDIRVVGIVFKYLNECIKLSEDNFDSDNERMMNWMIVIAGRLCLRDDKMANGLVGIYRQILDNNDRPQIINTTLIAFNDLGKKHTTILQNNFQCILGKMNSKFAITRVRTFRCVKDLILSGSIRLKGPILTSLLATLADESGEMAREADAFFIRYQRLYNKLLFQHCLRESPFDFNDEAYLEGAKLHPTYKSPLKGEEKTKSRRLIYNHIISTLDDNTLLSYFGQLKLLAVKTKDVNFRNSPNALAAVNDILFIMRRICFVTKGKKHQTSRGEAGEDDGEGGAEPDAVPSTSTAAEQQGRGRKSRQREGLEDPIKQLESCLRYVEESFCNLNSVMSPKLQQSYNKLCKALNMRFPNLVQFAQPAQFWDKYRNAKTSKSKRKRRRVSEDDEEGDEPQSEEDDIDSDNELPLERHKSKLEQRLHRKNSCDKIVTEMIFQPPDW
ncbi:uncharacterized protein LOC115628597 [Scaptodrosophila lebanonensis]|uniref:Uncharacterized protein LOC115628597 n=1 Tax=Drosophila lebanonensis TaxID=7225 RepID=A0A6J2TVR3_DROLE|nr:uncharacterized protein LOC115628597 [Scaptodrosophila lebanonensis]